MNIEDLLKDPEKAKEALDNAIRTQNKELAEILIPIVKNLYLIYRYARDIVGGKIKDEWEDIIATNPRYSYHYAYEVLNGPFPKGENAIATDAEYSYRYALNVLHEPFPKGENAIATDPFYSFFYACEVIKGPFLKGEDTISKDDYHSYEYAKFILNDRFIKGEGAIIKYKKYIDSYIGFLKEIGKLDEFLKDHPEVKL